MTINVHWICTIICNLMSEYNQGRSSVSHNTNVTQEYLTGVIYKHQQIHTHTHTHTDTQTHRMLKTNLGG